MTTLALLNHTERDFPESPLYRILATNDLRLYIDDFLESPRAVFQKNIIKNHTIDNATIVFWSKKILKLLKNTRDEYEEEMPMYKLWNHRYECEKITLETNEPLITKDGVFVQFAVANPIGAPFYLRWSWTLYEQIYQRSREPEMDEDTLYHYNYNMDLVLRHEDNWPYGATQYY